MAPFWKEYLPFCDYLRSHPADAAAYGALKYELSEEFPRDREPHIEGKTGFVRDILAKARV